MFVKAYRYSKVAGNASSIPTELKSRLQLVRTRNGIKFKALVIFSHNFVNECEF